MSGCGQRSRTGPDPRENNLAQAAVYFHFARSLFVDNLAQMRATRADAVRCLTTALPLLDPPGRRIGIPF